MTHRFLLVALVLITAACGADPNSPDANPYADRTYSRMSPCPTPPAGDVSLCDRGDGQTPRLVSIETCIAEVGGDPMASSSWNDTHPQRAECLNTARVGLSTIADIWRAVHAR